ncbi:hypothetical protein LSCM1_00566 [Leishmania martiniquensis]|uniref:Uncharacterized protein n=1 Tax=Leishmania martiniquensis TaxID=1580590 RepID=A0A836FKQ5_9TRYP|nr:hypothetical protein LSCM1_00566 [Leishmania martiniquensis]
MPAKKTGRTKSSPALVAREAELAQEAELLRQETQKGRLRNEEYELRQRIEEEERKLLEAYRIRERDVRNTLAEVERKAYYEAKEREMAATVAQKVQEVQEAQAKLELKVQENDLLEKEKASALRRVALLTNELELTLLRYTESQQQAAAAGQAHQEAQRTLESEYDALRQAYQELEMKNATLECEKVKAANAAEAAAATAAEEIAKTKKALAAAPSGDEETVMLLRVMQAEAERYKATATQLQKELTHAQKQEEKSNLLAGILNTQLESVREDNKRLHELAQRRQEELQAAGQLRRDAEAARQSALAEMEQTLSAAAVQQRQLELELDVRRTETEKLTTELCETRQECAALKEELKSVSHQAAQQAQTDHATNVAMQAELANLKKDLELALRAKETAEDEKFNHKILTRAEIDSLKARLQRLQETMERKDREAFETIAVLKADIEKQKSSSTQLLREDEVHIKELQAKLRATEAERCSLRSALDSLQKSSREREQELYEQLTQVTARHTSEREELEHLRADASRKETEYAHNIVCLNAGHENLKTKMNEMTVAAAQQRQTHANYVEQLRMEAKQLESSLTEAFHVQESARAEERERADMAERNVCRLQAHIKEMEQAARLNDVVHGEAVKALQAESRDLRSELSIAKRTIERLECAIGDQAGYRQLTELNDKLTKELEAYRRNVSALEDKTVALQVEAETMGGYKVKKAQEEKELMARRLQQAEQRYRRFMPLFAQLRVLVETHLPSYMHPELYAALEDYDHQMSLKTFNPIKGNKKAGAPLDAAATTNAPAAAAEENHTATIPVVMQPRPPSSSAAPNKIFKDSSIRSSRIVTGTDADYAAFERLPPIFNV